MDWLWSRGQRGLIADITLKRNYNRFQVAEIDGVVAIGGQHPDSSACLRAGCARATIAISRLVTFPSPLTPAHVDGVGEGLAVGVGLVVAVGGEN